MNKFVYNIANVNYTVQLLPPNKVESWNDETGQYECKKFPDKGSAKTYYLQEFKKFLFLK